MVYYTLDYRVHGRCPSSCILKEHAVLENGSVFILRRKVVESELGLLLRANLNHWSSDSDRPTWAGVSPPEGGNGPSCQKIVFSQIARQCTESINSVIPNFLLVFLLRCCTSEPYNICTCLVTLLSYNTEPQWNMELTLYQNSNCCRAYEYMFSIAPYVCQHL
jgi:hypothetical protein